MTHSLTARASSSNRAFWIVAVFATAVAAHGAPSAHANDAQREKAAQNLEQADADADGALTFDEFKRLIDLNAEDGIGRARMIQRFGRYDTAFGRVDANGDGLATFEELSEMAAQAR